LYYIRSRTGLVDPVTEWVYLRHGTSECWQLKLGWKSGQVTEDLTTTVVYSYKSLISDIKPYSLTHSKQMLRHIYEG